MRIRAVASRQSVVGRPRLLLMICGRLTSHYRLRGLLTGDYRLTGLLSRLTTVDCRLSTTDCRLSTTAAAALLVFFMGGAVSGQVIQRPERPLRGVFGSDPPIDPNRTRQDLILNLSTLGGYDDNPSPTESGGTDAFTPREPGYTGYADASLRYRRVHQTQSFEVNGHGYGNAYRNLGLTPTYGGELQARVAAPLGRSNQFDFSAAGQSAPYYTIGAFAPLRSDVAPETLPDASPAYGFSIRRSLTGTGAVSLTTRWARRHTLTETYRYQIQDFVDGIGDGHQHEGSVAYSLSLGRRSSLTSTVRHSKAEYADELTIRPMQQDAAEFGYRHEHQLRQGKRWSFALGGGTTYVQTAKSGGDGRLDYATPSGYGNLRFDFARTWSIRGDYRRGVSVLEGLTADSFVTDTALIGVGGYIGPRTELALSTGFSDGAASVATESRSSFDSYTATIQLRFLLTRWWSAVISNNVYRYQLHGFDTLPPGLRSQLDRNAVRVGMTFDLPLYGSYVADRRPPSPRGN